MREMTDVEEKQVGIEMLKLIKILVQIFLF